MSSVFNIDKAQLMELILDRYDTGYRRTGSGWQKIRCINEAGHAMGDRHPSASVHLEYGYYQCFACGLRGDGFDLMLELEGVKAKDVLDSLHLEPGKEESEFLF